MERREEHDEKAELNDGRRKLIKAAAIAGGAAVAVGALPGEWKKPLATVGGLPAHAQTSDAPITIPDNSLVIDTALPDPRARVNGIMSPRARFAYIDPICDIDDTATLWTHVGPCGTVEFNNVPLSAVPASRTGDACNGTVGFAFHPCWAGYGSLSVQLSKGNRHSNVVNASFFWSPPA